MIDRRMLRNSSCAVVAAGLGLALCFPPQVFAQDGYSSDRRAPSTITCSSNDGRRVYCAANTRAGVRLVRQLSGSPCEETSSWGYDSRGVWVDHGCRAEFDISGSRLNSNTNTITCSSDDGQRVYCNVDTSRGVRMVRQLSGAPCQQGSSWGYDGRSIWVDQGCRAEFDASGGGGSRTQMTTIGAGTTISVRTNETIDVRNSNGRVFSGAVDRDVTEANGTVVIPRGSAVELLVRSTSNRDLVLDLDSINVNGQRYAVAAYANIGGGQRDGIGRNARTGEFIGGGAVLGTIIGAIAGGGRGAAIGAASGAGAGAGTQYFTQGRNVRIPAESLLTFRLEQPLEMGVPDNGTNRRGRHYHTPYR